MKRKLVILISLLLLGIIVLTACNGSSSINEKHIVSGEYQIIGYGVDRASFSYTVEDPLVFAIINYQGVVEAVDITKVYLDNDVYTLVGSYLQIESGIMKIIKNTTN